MTNTFLSIVSMAALISGAQMGFDVHAAEAGKLRVMYDQAKTGFGFPESVVYDPSAKVLYVSNFGGSELKPGEKDGMGRISKVSLTGEILESRFLPDTGDVMNKPKGL